MLKQLLVLSSILLVLTGCHSRVEKRDPNLPKMPYQSWKIGGYYPHYFRSKPFQVTMKTQSGQWKILDMISHDNQNSNPGEWRLPRSNAHGTAVWHDLPSELYICWASFADQTFYKTKIEVPLWVRQEMVTPHQYYSYARNKDHIGYRNTIVIGFAPGGSVTGWITGVPQQEAIEFGQGVTQRIPQGSDVCPNPYPHGKITEISDEAKAWLKENGMPEAWQEKNNNITIGPDIRIKEVPSISREL